ncbi:hypothetical protein V2J09_014416 [Rumex salicifolius]
MAKFFFFPEMKLGFENTGEVAEGGHLPFLRKCLLRTSLFLRSLSFLASFIFNLCSCIICNLDSNGRFSTGTIASFSLDCSPSPPMAASSIFEALTIAAAFRGMEAWI